MMKNFLKKAYPTILAAMTLLIVAGFLRYNLYISTHQLAHEFQTQNFSELYSGDTPRITTRLHSFSRSLNWVCIEAEVGGAAFYRTARGDCSSGLFQQKSIIFIPEANNIKVSFILKFSRDLQILFIIFFILQSFLIASIILATKKVEKDKRNTALNFYKLSRKMFHDIRSPLAALNMIANNIDKKTTNEYFVLTESINRINDIANSLLIQTQTKNLIDNPGYHSLEEIFEQIIKEKELEFSKKIKIDFSSSEISKAFVQPSDFKRILSNLLNNSIEACQAQSPFVTISIFQLELEIFILIKDNGNGIPPHILPLLGTIEATSKIEGNGIGYKSAYDLLQNWQGSLKIIESNSYGTIIEIKLQALDYVNAKKEKSKVILLDDDELIHLTWGMRAKKANIDFLSFKNEVSFRADILTFSKDDDIYIDSELGTIKGEFLASELFELGFKNVSITSGHSPENFKKYRFLKSIISKKAPF